MILMEPSRNGSGFSVIIQMGLERQFNHTYSKAGTYTVTLTVTDNEGATNTDTTTCVITQPTTDLQQHQSSLDQQTVRRIPYTPILPYQQMQTMIRYNIPLIGETLYLNLSQVDSYQMEQVLP